MSETKVPGPKEVLATDDVAEEAPDTEVDENASESSLDAAVEALLFSSEIPLPARRLAGLAACSKGDLLESVDRLNVFYAETRRAFRIVPIAGGLQLVTMPEHGALLAKLHKEHVPTRLSRAALETLSIIAFKQPVTRAEIDAIRGVSASDGVLRHLLERKLTRIAGRAEAPGRPLLYATTREFLGYFGLSDISDLPRTDELNALLAGDVPVTADDDDEEREDLFDSSPTFGGEEGMMEGAERREQDDAPAAEPPGREATSPAMSHSGEESDDDGVPPT